MTQENNIFQEKDKDAVMNYCIDFINRNGYLRVGYAAELSFPQKKFENDLHKAAFYNSVSARLVNTGKYVREECKSRPDDYDMLLNPAYFHNKSIQSSNKITRIIALTSVGVSLLTLVGSLAKSDTRLIQQIQETNQTLQQQAKALQEQNTFLKEINSSIQNVKADTTKK